MVNSTTRTEAFTKSTAFRDDRSAELVTITESTFDDCKLLSKARFTVGERLRLHIPGQGLIEVKVRWTCGSTYGAIFLSECRV